MRINRTEEVSDRGDGPRSETVGYRDALHLKW